MWASALPWLSLLHLQTRKPAHQYESEAVDDGQERDKDTVGKAQLVVGDAPSAPTGGGKVRHSAMSRMTFYFVHAHMQLQDSSRRWTEALRLCSHMHSPMHALICRLHEPRVEGDMPVASSLTGTNPG